MIVHSSSIEGMRSVVVACISSYFLSFCKTLVIIGLTSSLRWAKWFRSLCRTYVMRDWRFALFWADKFNVHRSSMEDIRSTVTTCTSSNLLSFCKTSMPSPSNFFVRHQWLENSSRLWRKMPKEASEFYSWYLLNIHFIKLSSMIS